MSDEKKGATPKASKAAESQQEWCMCGGSCPDCQRLNDVARGALDSPDLLKQLSPSTGTTYEERAIDWIVCWPRAPKGDESGIEACLVRLHDVALLIKSVEASAFNARPRRNDAPAWTMTEPLRHTVAGILCVTIPATEFERLCEQRRPEAKPAEPFVHRHMDGSPTTCANAESRVDQLHRIVVEQGEKLDRLRKLLDRAADELAATPGNGCRPVITRLIDDIEEALGNAEPGRERAETSETVGGGKAHEPPRKPSTAETTAIDPTASPDSGEAGTTHANCVRGGGPSVIFLNDGSKIRGADLRHVTQESEPNACVTPSCEHGLQWPNCSEPACHYERKLQPKRRSSDSSSQADPFDGDRDSDLTRPAPSMPLDEVQALVDFERKAARLETLKEARRRVRDIEIKDEHAYALGLAVGVLYVMRDETKAKASDGSSVAFDAVEVETDRGKILYSPGLPPKNKQST